MRTARSPVYEDALDKYRRDVEKWVQDWIDAASDEDLEPFFEHIMTLFARGVSAVCCARAWQESTSRDRGPTSSRMASARTGEAWPLAGTDSCARRRLRTAHKLDSVSWGAEATSRADSAKCLEHTRDRTVRRTRPLTSG